MQSFQAKELESQLENIRIQKSALNKTEQFLKEALSKIAKPKRKKQGALTDEEALKFIAGLSNKKSNQ